MPSFTELVDSITNEVRGCLRAVSPSSIEEAIEAIAGSKRVFLAGSGRSGTGIRAHAIRLMHLGKTVYLVGEVAVPPITGNDLLLVGSGSGRTKTALVTAQEAKKRGARILVITIDPQSPLAQLADNVVEVPAPAPKVIASKELPKSIQPMGNLFEQALFILLDILVMMIMEREGISSEEMFGRHANLE